MDNKNKTQASTEPKALVIHSVVSSFCPLCGKKPKKCKCPDNHFFDDDLH